MHRIFSRYLELGSVHRLQQELAQAGIISKRRTTAQGKVVGGVVLSRGALFHMLRNRLYLGEIPHKDRTYPGEHAAIIEPALFEAVQARLTAARRPSAGERKVAGALLTGRIVDATGEGMSPAFSYGRGGRVYRYYVSTSLQQGRRACDDGVLRRIPAKTVESLVAAALGRLLPGRSNPLEEMHRVQITAHHIRFTLSPGAARLARPFLNKDEIIEPDSAGCATITIPVQWPTRGGATQVVAGVPGDARPDPVLIAALRKAHRMLNWSGKLPSLDAAPVSAYNRKIMRLALLAPDIQQDILAGRQSSRFNLAFFMNCEIPLDWNAQRRLLRGA